MFTEYVGAFDRLRGRQRPDGSIWTNQAIDLIQQVFGDCSQTLQHNGPVEINGKLEIINCDDEALNVVCGDILIEDGTVGGGAPIHSATAITDWVAASGNSSYVDGVGDEGSVRVYLPRSSGSDPNVRQGDTIFYLRDSDGDAICISDVNDDPIGFIKAWYWAADDEEHPIPPGWEELTAARGRLIVGTGGGYSLDDTQGRITEPKHRGVTGSNKDDEMSEETSGVTITPTDLGVNGTGTGYVGSASIGGVVGYAGMALVGSGGSYTDYRVTGISVDDHAPHYHVTDPGTAPPNNGAGGGSAHKLDTVTGTESPTLKHTVNEPNSGQGHRHGWSAGAVADLLEITPNHSHDMEGTGHIHAITDLEFTLPPHGHDVDEDPHTHEGPEHTHDISDFPHVKGGNLMPYIVMTWIIRTS